MSDGLIATLQKLLLNSSKVVIVGHTGTGKTYAINTACARAGIEQTVIDASCKRSMTSTVSKLNLNTSRLCDTCIVFDSFDALIDENMSTQSMIESVGSSTHAVVIEIHPKNEKKITKLFKHNVFHVLHANDYPFSKAQLHRILLEYAKSSNIRISKVGAMRLVETHSPNISAMKNAVLFSDGMDKTAGYGEAVEKAMWITQSHDIDTRIKLAQADIFAVPAVFQENYISYVKPHDVYSIASSFARADVLHTQMYHNQSWHLIDEYIAQSVLYPCSKMRVRPNAAMKYCTNLSKLSNIVAKNNTVDRLGSELGTTTLKQAYVAWKLHSAKVVRVTKPLASSMKRLFSC